MPLLYVILKISNLTSTVQLLTFSKYSIAQSNSPFAQNHIFLSNVKKKCFQIDTKKKLNSKQFIKCVFYFIKCNCLLSHNFYELLEKKIENYKENANFSKLVL